MTTRHLVLVGGGHAHLEVLRRFAERPEPGLRLTLIAREPRTLYSGMVPGVIARDYELEEATIPLAPLARAAGARFLVDEVCGLDLAASTVRCASGKIVAFDLVSLDTGGVADLSVPGAAEHAIPARPIADFVARIGELDEIVRSVNEPALISVVGGGAAGCELALALSMRYRRSAQISLHCGTPRLLPDFPRAAARKVERCLGWRLGRAYTGDPVVTVEEQILQRGYCQSAFFDAVVWATGVAAPPWLRSTALALDERGFVRVDRSLRSVSDPRVFAAGDVAAIEGASVPKAGVWAVRAGPVLAENLRLAARGQALRSWRPQRRALVLINAGWKQAIGIWGPFVFEGEWVWRWKDSIDRRFVARYRITEPA